MFETPDFSLDVAKAIKKIHLNSAEMNATILGNFDIVDGEIDPGFQHTGTWYDYLTGESIEVTDINDPVALAPGGYRIYTDVALETPNLPTSVHSNSAISNNVNAYIYPNPATNSLHVVSSTTGFIQFEVYNLSGQLAHRYNYHSESDMTYKFDLNLEPGLYIYKIHTQESSCQGKLVVE